MLMKIEHMQDKEVTYNFSIHHVCIKHHYHHEINCLTTTVHAAISARMRQGSAFSSLTR